MKKIAKPVQSKDIATGVRIKVENLSKPIKDLLGNEKKEPKYNQENIRSRKEYERKKTESEKMQEELEPLPWCPMSDE
jgi:hypothetical protein|tara:strand:- start:178 stop:411 length:234 start_codon:yes stop_codon:yes gene_type:complete